MLGKELPAWALPGALALSVLILCVIGWRVWAGGEDSAGPPKNVHPGQYDLRAEVAKMRAAKQNSVEAR